MSSSETCQWDVVVVGASFAGAACALAARRAGLRVCVLERKRDPGIKLHTTGIIVSEAAEQTPLSRIPREYVRRVERVRLYAPNLRSILLQRRDYYFLTTDTPSVMRWLADELRAAGVELRLMQSFTDARRADDAWQVEGLGRTRWLVGADAERARLRAGLGRVRDFLYGIEYEFAARACANPMRCHCSSASITRTGYIGWAAQIRRCSSHWHSGTGRRAPAFPTSTARARFGEALGRTRPIPTATRAGLIPCGGPVWPLSAPGVILTGDAAGLVSPVTAGGIHSAWQHAGRSATRSLRI